MTTSTLSLDTAGRIITMGAHPRANSQLEGAVAVHNILQREGVAYLADEVGLGKTYVALAAAALFRHYDPSFRVLVIAPKENIQRKWQRDWRTFVSKNMTVTDLRVRALDGGPARPVRHTANLRGLVEEATLSPDQDFFARLTSFSHALGRDQAETKDRVRQVLPWVDLRRVPQPEASRRDFLAQAYNAALPTYDLVIIDEAHNLKHGIRIEDGRVHRGSIRNAMLAQVLGHPDVAPHAVFEDTYRPLASRVLMLSATPIEDSFAALWRQVHLVGKHAPDGRADFSDLRADDDAAARCATRIMVRRVNTIEVSGERLTKNLYRRLWRQGGVATYDEPMPSGDLRQRLTVALVQKKVSELVDQRFNGSFQMGMLASFESFAQTALKDDEATFDGDQASSVSDAEEERIGIDTRTVNDLAADHYRVFGTELAHPKMDALVTDLSQVWDRGGKALVFVRRVASVQEIKRKVDEAYDQWLFAYLERVLPTATWAAIERIIPTYAKDREERGRDGGGEAGAEDDVSGAGTFFAWFFRGRASDVAVATQPSLPESGASLARKLGQDSGPASTFFALPLASMVMDCEPDAVLTELANRLNRSEQSVLEDLAARARRYVRESSGRRESYEAVQAAVLELLADPWVTALRTDLDLTAARTAGQRVDVLKALSTPTFFTELHRWPQLRTTLLPDSPAELTTRERLDQQILLSHALAAAARLGRPMIDLYASVCHASHGSALTETIVDSAINSFLAELDQQHSAANGGSAYRELADIAREFDLIRTLDLPETTSRGYKAVEGPTACANLLRSQQPAVGMSGTVNQTAVRQFRMPGYPKVLVCTDVLQEGEDLHTFCDRVIHYGVAWTPSSMEQRTGRVDRLRSLAERRFMDLESAGKRVGQDDKIQVQLPYLHDSIERAQAQTVLRRMQRFTDLMHVGSREDRDERRLHIATAMLTGTESVGPSDVAPLTTAFDVRAGDLRGRARQLAVDPNLASEWWGRLTAAVDRLRTGNQVDLVEHDAHRLVTYASVTLGDRVQPFTAQLRSVGSAPVVTIRTPVARMIDLDADDLDEQSRGLSHRLVMTPTTQRDRQYDVAIEGDVILVDPDSDSSRVAWLITRLTSDADTIERVLTDGDLDLNDVRETLSEDLR